MAKQAAKKTKKSQTKGLEEDLWDSANKLRGSVESFEYKHIVLSLIFLKLISDKFKVHKQNLIDEGLADFFESVEFYTKHNVFRRVIRHYSVFSTNSMKVMVSKEKMEEIPMICPPLSLQERFQDAFAKLLSLNENLNCSHIGSSDVFNSLSQRDFTGQL